MIIDIDLANQNGFNLVESIKKKNRDAKVIVLSHKNDLEIARKVISLRAHDYLLKPVNENLLLQSIQECIEQYKRIRLDINKMANSKFKLIKPQIDYEILLNIAINGDYKKIEQLFLFYGFSIKDIVIATMTSDANTRHINLFAKTLYNYGFNVIYSKVANKYIFLIVCNKIITRPLANKVRQLINNINADNIILGIGFIKQNAQDFNHSYHESLEEIYKGRAIKSITSTQIFNDFKSNDLQRLYSKAYKSYIFEDLKSIQNGIYELTISILHLSDDVINEYLKAFLYYHESQMKSIIGDFKNPPMPKIIVDRSNPYESLMVQLLDFYDYIMLPLRNSSNKQALKLALKVEDYIKKNFKKQLPLEEIANRFDISPSYLCRIFIKYTSSSIVDYINECRISESKKLLLTDKSIKDVAYESGFRTPTYFGRVFKKNIKLTPKEYKEKFKSNN